MPYRPWLNNELAQLGLKTTLNSHFSAVVSPQIKLWNDTWDWKVLAQNGSSANPLNQHLTISLADAEGIVSFGNKESFAFKAAVGVMPFKYNEDAKNLGEYLFRTGEHPAYIQTSFDNAYATLTGVRLNAQMFNTLSLDILFTQETQIVPINDWSMSILAGYKLPHILDVGAGVAFDRLIPVSGILDNPVIVKNGLQDTFYSNDGTVQSWKWGGTKIMAHVSFDPKGLFPSGISGIFGKEDCKIYGEAAILGLHSDSAFKKTSDSLGKISYVVDSNMNFYSDISQRIPIMFGFNIPTFKLLDFLSVEVEWFGWPYSPSLYNYQSLVYTLPEPIIPNVTLPNGNSQKALYTKDNNWKYSFNFRKTIWGHFSMIGQIARDHTRHDVYYNGFADPEEAFLHKDEWGWWLKLQYSL
jgi:hypothetical protein